MVQTRNLDQYAEIHRTRRYGDTGIHKLRVIQPWFRLVQPVTALDYGAGQSNLINEIRSPFLVRRDRYDPAIPAISSIPLERYDLVICTDVFEHLDDAEVPTVLKDIATRSDQVIFCIDTRPASTVLPNGENAHATVKPPSWWLGMVREVFPNAELIRVKGSNAYIKTWRNGLFTHLFARLSGRFVKSPQREQ